MLYEDDLGNTYFKDDLKYLEDGTTINIREYLRNQVWEDGYNSKLRTDYIDTHTVSAYEVMPVDVYYLVNPVTQSGSPIVIDS